MDKRFFASMIAVLVLAAGIAYGDEAAEVYKRLYREADSIQARAAAVTSMVSANDPAAAPALGAALEDLVRISKTVKPGSERELFERTVRLCVAFLGQWRRAESIQTIWEALNAVEDPLAKAEAAMALGSLRATEYAERLALMLRNIDMKPGPDKDAEEKIAYGLVVALEKMKDVRGFSPVFYASVGWYSKRVRDQAARSLPNIADDPTDPVKELLVSENVDGKLLLLDLELASKAPAERKIEAARLALEQGQIKTARDRTEAGKHAALRTAAMAALVELKASGGASVGRYVESFKNGDVDEKLVALQALGTDGSDAAARVLSEILLDFNEKQKSGVSDEVRNRLVKAAIQNAALSRNKLVVQALSFIQINEKWSNSIIAAAAEALKALQ